MFRINSMNKSYERLKPPKLLTDHSKPQLEYDINSKTTRNQDFDIYKEISIEE